MESEFGESALSVHGSLSPDEKERRLLAWLNGERPVLISKPRVAGYGLNFQHCARAAFVGLSYSFEQLVQAVGRVHRFGQMQEVHIWIVGASTEGAIWDVVRRKRDDHEQLQDEMVRAARELHTAERTARRAEDYRPTKPLRVPAWLTSEVA